LFTRNHPYTNTLAYVWSVGDLDWVPMEQPGGAAGGGLTDAELRATPVPVLASIDTTGLATEAKQTTGNASLASIDGKLTNPLPVSGTVDVTGSSVAASILTIGQQTMANSVPVTLASNQGALPLPTGASTAAKQDTGNTSIGSVDTKTPALGQALAAASVPVVLTAAQITTLTPLATVAANTTEVRPATATLSNLASSAASQQVLASTPTRRGAYFYNDSTTRCLIKLGTTASATSFTVPLVAGAYYELPVPAYSGRIDAIWDSANGNLRITELT
jgi:hypothetical protein